MGRPDHLRRDPERIVVFYPTEGDVDADKAWSIQLKNGIRVEHREYAATRAEAIEAAERLRVSRKAVAVREGL